MQSDSTKAVEYRDVVGFPGYRVGDDGSVWSLWQQGCPTQSPRWFIGSIWRRKATSPCHGYRIVGLMREGRQFSRRVHRLVLEAFVGPCPEGMEGCHEDGNRSNNRLTNLRWDTPAANEADKLIHGTRARGVTQGSSKLTEEKVREIRLRCSSGEKQRDVAKSLGVRQGTVSFVVSGTTWKHVV